jgi:exodeoxyribonuclease VII large subunit
MEEERKYYSVSAYNTSIKRYLDNIDELKDVHIKGEISNWKGATRGHLYFTLKDEESRISVVMFKNAADTLDFTPKEGDKVLVDGRISAYPASGTYQVYINKMRLDGEGDLLKKLEELKKKLAAEGLFDEAHKKPIPKFPKKIGVVTSSNINQAAVHDIITTINRRYPLCEVILFPAMVQGEQAKFDIVKQIEEANKEKYELDTLIVGRGGGSIEDLWAFNEEIVARAIYDSRVPIISAVGHDIDYTIADFVADLRAATPTAGAELAVPNLVDVIAYLKQLEIRSNQAVTNKINHLREILNKIKKSYVLENPLASFEIKEQKLDELINRLNTNIQNKLDTSKVKLTNILNKRVLRNPEDILIPKKNSLELLINKLELLNPLSVIKKGYSVIESDKKIIKSVKDVKKNDNLKIKVIDGIINANVEGVENNG